MAASSADWLLVNYSYVVQPNVLQAILSDQASTVQFTYLAD